MELMTPVGRIVQGSVALQAQKDMDTNQPLKNDDGTPVMGIFLALAFPKLINGQPNQEYATFHAQLMQAAAAAWPHFFPQGATGPCINPKFSFKVQDGDGFDSNGKSVATKPGFAGHWIVRMYTSYPFGCYNEGKFQAHEVLQKPEDIIKRGFWVRVLVEVKSNNATGNQVPGISIFPKLLSFVQRGEEIQSGPDAAAAFGGAALGYVPAAPAGSPIPSPSQQLPTPPVVAAPVPVPTPPVPVPVPVPTPAPVQQPQYTPTAALPAGVTIEAMLAQGWTYEAMVASGYVTKNY